jgi:hypothetical protein
MPLPQTPLEMVVTLSLPDRHVVRMRLRPMAVQILPTVHGENSVILDVDAGFMMYSPLALQVVLLSGQHVSEDPVLQSSVQSCTPPKL